MTYKKPTEQLHAILSGEQEWKQAPEAIQSWARFYVYQAAERICSIPDIQKRRESLAALPDFIRPRIEDEIRRIWPLR